MLTTKPLKQRNDKPGAEGIVAYCQHSKRSPGHQAGYYVSKPAPSRWAGSLAAELGFSGPVDSDKFRAALEGRIGDEDLSRDHAKRRYGHDLTVSAPKSFSLIALVAGDERLVDGHHKALQEMFDYIEAEVAGARRGKKGQDGRDKTGIVAAVHDHEDSRTVDGKADAQYHSHCIILNVSKNADGKLHALDLDWGEDAVRMHIADAIYKNALARHVQELGYSIERTEDGFEIAGISREQIEEFSKRKEQIDDALEAQGLTRKESSSEQRDAANQRTRQSKSQLSQSEQRWEWRQRAREAGLDLDSLRRRAEQSSRAGIEDRTADAVKAGARDISERETVFQRDKARLGALRAGVGYTEIAQVDEAIDNGEAGLIRAGDGALTTADALRREQHILAIARAGRGAETALMAADEADAFILAREQRQGFAYSAGQRQAMRLGLTSSDKYVSIVGAAGAGKTTSMQGVVEAARAQGFEITGIAPSTSAARELREAGADDTRTIASFLAQKPRQQQDANRLVIMDEAGMVSARDMERVIESIERDGGRLLLVGDPRQLAAVEAGTPYAQMIQTGAVETVRIEEIKRQKDPELRRIAEAFARGEADKAVAAARPYVVEAEIEAADRDDEGRPKPTTAERRQGIAAHTAQTYLALPDEERQSSLVVAGTNEVRRLTNERIRKGLVERGEVAGDAVTLKALDKAGMTREAMTRAESYRVGMVVRINEKAGRRWTTNEYRVARVEAGKVILADTAERERAWTPTSQQASVYTTRPMDVATGDRLVFREPLGRGKNRVVNGSTCTVQAISETKIEVKLDDDRIIDIDRKAGIALDRGWCLTIHQSQGKTVDRAIVAGEANRLATAESAYVAASRQRLALSIVTDNRDRLAASWQKWAHRQSAIGAAEREQEQHTREVLDRLRVEAAAALGTEGDLDREHAAEPEPTPSAGARPEQQPAPRRRPRM